jgi:hypothetical protein
MGKQLLRVTFGGVRRHYCDRPHRRRVAADDGLGNSAAISFRSAGSEFARWVSVASCRRLAW